MQYHPLGPGTLLVRRKITHPRLHRDIDVFGNFWTLTMGSVPAKKVKFKRDGELFFLPSEPGLIFLPPFSVVDWEVEPCSFSFDSIICSLPLPEDMPRFPVCYLNKENHAFPNSVEEIFQIIRNSASPIPIGTCREPSAVARKAKELIDKTFPQKTGISEIAKQLKLSHTVMGRAFKASFGLTPIAYRNKLRISDSLRLLLMENCQVSKAAQGVGFDDMSRFYRLFRRTYLTRPSKYRT